MGKPYKSNVGEMAWCEELEMEIPAGWEFGEFKNVCDKIFSGGTPNTNIKEYWNGDVFWLSSGETRNSVIIDTERTISKIGVKNSSTKKAIEGDSIIASAGQGKTRGQTSLCKIETYINQSVICIRPIANHYKIWNFLNLYSRYQELRNDSDAHSIRGSLLGKDIGSLKTILPKDEIVIRFDKVTNPFFDKIYLCRKIHPLMPNDAQSVLHSKMTKVETQKEIV
ncbi:restriction endonuclease subunit S [Flavobacterium sp. GNP001]